ncbi:cupin domain-containing protein [Massilia sp.]|uniref:ribosomal protein uL16 3-hydroxylase n=1 Tax=Massilia sp. TaxID=1882437 RepID=UPI0028B23BDA|nr:cupin domain-containing protein [Massilia sp.]
MKKLQLLGNITPAQFLRDYWHKKPLLIRGAIPGFKPLLKFERLADLATKNFVESRLVTQIDGEWNMQHGPLTELPPRTQPNWTMLVQGVNLYDEKADDLLRQFRFLPDARLDDLMISYATDGAGVGPHFDSYDVFLLQAHGKRRWKISAQQDLSLVDGLPLKILSNFTPEEEFVLEPGDMLYLPPHYAHDGIAEGECMTYSIGFRSPSFQELGEAFLQFMADSIDLPGRYADPDQQPAKNPAEIPREMLSTITEELNKVRWDEEDVTIFFGEYMSEPKHNVFFTGPAKPLTVGRFMETAAKKGLKLSAKTLMLYRGKHVFINGESFAVSRADKVVLDVLANERRLDGAALEQASDDVLEALYTWYQDGWIELGQAS